MRLKPALRLKAWRESPLLYLLLPETRSLADARVELRWIREELEEREVLRLCILRGQKGLPLQYVLGNQPFGDSLDIKCRRGVLIPRQETEEWGIKLARTLRKYLRTDNSTGSLRPVNLFPRTLNHELNVLDLCTGSGCLSLLMAEQLQQLSGYYVNIKGIDISPMAVALAAENLNRNMHLIDSNVHVNFELRDLFQPFPTESTDLIVANPPYISKVNYESVYHTMSSVRKFEPKLALLGGLEFYTRIFDIADQNLTKAVVCEVCDREQMLDVVNIASRTGWKTGHMTDSNGIVRTIVAYKTRGSEAWSWMSELFD
ncbi:S-adenosyl-L-methionine-dependent methyltransferase [Dipodascopsis uninucleata]